MKGNGTLYVLSISSNGTQLYGMVKNFLKRYILIILVVLVVVLAAAAVYLYKSNMSLKANPDQIAQAEVEDLVTRVGMLMVLPTGETPTVATVSDPEALKDQAFFAGSKKGDKVLIYTNAKKAVLYDPVANKIVNVAPVDIGAAQKGVQQSAPQATTETTDTKKQ